jgi:DNA-binding CsgD family transcriptional regulator
MNVCGLSILTRKTLVTRQYGGDAWSSFYREIASKHACFRSLITAHSEVPLEAFLAFHDELMRRFFKQDDASYLKLGRSACRSAVRDGPLKELVAGNDLANVVESLPKFHGAYFKEAATWSEAHLTPEGVEFKVFDLPQAHPYFEHFIVGYIAEVLEMNCANPIEAVRLDAKGTRYSYLLHGTSVSDHPRSAHGALLSPPPKALSDRELEVLQLVADGCTNEEIGTALGISRKTAQHHVAHAYRKLGVTGRVAATVWLMERGMLRH